MGGERWCVIVDDQAAQADAIARNLTMRGLPSRGFLDPEDALAFAQENSGSIVFAMFDVCLGKRSGADYARLFREKRLALEIALMTAYEEQLSPTEAEQLKNMGILILPKPVNLERLSKEVLHQWYEPSVKDQVNPGGIDSETPPPAPEGPPKADSKAGGDDRPPGKRFQRSRKIAVGVAVAIVAVVVAVFTFRTVTRFQSSKVAVPESHFQGQHGKNKKVLVFVHGVTGDLESTWVNSETHAFWPEMIKEDDQFKDFDVFLYGYSSPAFRRASDVADIAKRLGQQLEDRGMFSNYEEIDFVTHSMGGLVTKRMLDTLNNPLDVGNLRKVHCVIYISVPGHGAQLADLASWISLNPQFRSMSPNDASDFLNSVEDDWAKLLRDRPASAPFPRSFSAYETLPMDGVTVVPRLYTSEVSDGTIMPFDYNHADIVKPGSSGSDVYMWVAARIIEASSIKTAGNPHP